jgi:hypothetical protein
MKMVRINLNKKSLIIVGIFLFTFILLSFALATWSSGDHLVSHDSDDLKVTIGGNEYSLQEAIDGGLLGGGGNINLADCQWSPTRYYESDQNKNCIDYFGEGYVMVNFDGIKNHGYIRYNKIQCCKLI